MADEEKNENEEAEGAAEGEEEPTKSKKPLILGGGVFALVAVAWIASMMAVPAVVKVPSYSGPFVAPLTDQQIQVNLKGEGARRFLVMSLNAVYDAYEEPYVAGRMTDALYMPLFMDAVIDIGSRKDREQVTSQADRDIFKQELRTAVDPILFPVHIGTAMTPYEKDDLSGLGPGESIYDATLRGPHHEHVVHIDALEKTIQLDEGDVVTYEGTESNLELIGSMGKVVFVDVTDIDPEFVGDVNVGVQGRIRRLTFSELLVQ